MYTEHCKGVRTLYSSLKIKAILHRDCAKDAKSDFLSDCTGILQAYYRMSKNPCARWRKICKQISYKADRRALCGVASNPTQERYSGEQNMRRQLGGAERISSEENFVSRNKRNCTVVGVKKGGTHEIFQSSESCVRFKSYTD